MVLNRVENDFLDLEMVCWHGGSIFRSILQGWNLTWCNSLGRKFHTCSSLNSCRLFEFQSWKWRNFKWTALHISKSSAPVRLGIPWRRCWVSVTSPTSFQRHRLGKNPWGVAWAEVWSWGRNSRWILELKSAVYVIPIEWSKSRQFLLHTCPLLGSNPF